MRALVAVLILVPGPAFTQEVPFPDYFTGTYDLVARVPGVPATALLDRVTISSKDGAFPLILQACTLGQGELTPEAPMHEGGFPMVGQFGDLNLTCDIMNNGDNYPIINCYLDRAGEFGLLTLWPTIFDPPEGETCR
jgi:hypothetical protein